MRSGVRRVLMTTDTLGGVWAYALELCRGLGQRGVEVVLAALGPPPDAQQRAAARGLDNLTVCAAHYRLEWMRDPWEDVERSGDWLQGLEALHRPDVIHLNTLCHGSLSWQAPALVVAHSCVGTWHQAVRGRPPGPEWDAYRERVAAGLQGAELVVAPTRAMLSALVGLYGPPRQMRVIPNGRSAAEYIPRRKQPVVLSAGRVWDEAKNMGALAAVAGQLPWPVLVAGPTRHPEGGERRLENVRALGPLSPRALGHWMGRAELFASPARYEPFGLTALEAGLAGCALVLGDIPSLREVWGEAAVWVDPADPDALRRALAGLIEDPRARRARALAARRRAVSYTPARMLASYLDSYRTLLLERQGVARRITPRSA